MCIIVARRLWQSMARVGTRRQKAVGHRGVLVRLSREAVFLFVILATSQCSAEAISSAGSSARASAATPRAEGKVHIWAPALRGTASRQGNDAAATTTLPRAEFNSTTMTTSQPSAEFSSTSHGIAPPNATSPSPIEARTSPWIEGTWTTGYWDCCKPSCSWPGKGNVDRPVQACSARTGEVLTDPMEKSVCDGGDAASCHRCQPITVSPTLSFGFAAAAVSGQHGLQGDSNCGQCYQLQFLDRSHDGGWGGAHQNLVNKNMVVQVTNIGYDVTGSHSFDIQIPGAGQGLFSNGCTVQYPGFGVGDFDCDNRYGGCTNKSGCQRLPPVLQPGCTWRYDWFHWFREAGRTNNPWVRFRRVRCPRALTALSGSTPLDDRLFRPFDADEQV